MELMIQFVRLFSEHLFEGDFTVFWPLGQAVMVNESLFSINLPG